MAIHVRADIPGFRETLQAREAMVSIPTTRRHDGQVGAAVNISHYLQLRMLRSGVILADAEAIDPQVSLLENPDERHSVANRLGNYHIRVRTLGENTMALKSVDCLSCQLARLDTSPYVTQGEVLIDHRLGGDDAFQFSIDEPKGACGRLICYL